MTTIRHVETLFYYDGTQVFEGCDAVGGHYVGMMVEPEDEQDRFLIRDVSPENLLLFRSGSLDLRSLLLKGDDYVWYLASAPRASDESFDCVPQEGSVMDSGFLPEPGFLLNERIDPPFVVPVGRALHQVTARKTPRVARPKGFPRANPCGSAHRHRGEKLRERSQGNC
jgi:hypothetical protein